MIAAMPKLMHPITHHLAALVLPLWLAACSGMDADPTMKWGMDKLYTEAKDLRNSGSWERAIEYYEKLENRAAGTLLAEQAMLDKAYCYYKSDSNVNPQRARALATLERFLREHPGSEAVDYALYLKGLVNFDDDTGVFGQYDLHDLAMREQNAAKESFSAFKQLLQQYPHSVYVADAKARMVFIIQLLSESELAAARFYFGRKAYLAASGRALAVVRDYPGSQSQEEALSILARSYAALDLPQLQQDTWRILRLNFPASRFLAAAEAKPEPR